MTCEFLQGLQWYSMLGQLRSTGAQAGNYKAYAQVTQSMSPPAGAGLNSITAPGIEVSRPLAGARVVRRLQSDNAVIGRIDDLGYLQGVEGYKGKLGALGEDSRVIVPAVDTEKAKRAAIKGMEIVPAIHWKEAARRARRPNGRVLFGQGWPQPSSPDCWP